VAAKTISFKARVGVPQAYGLIVGTAGEDATVWRECKAQDSIRVSAQSLRFAGIQIPDDDSTVGPAAGKPTAVQGMDHGANASLLSAQANEFIPRFRIPGPYSFVG